MRSDDSSTKKKEKKNKFKGDNWQYLTTGDIYGRRLFEQCLWRTSRRLRYLTVPREQSRARLRSRLSRYRQEMQKWIVPVDTCTRVQIVVEESLPLKITTFSSSIRPVSNVCPISINIIYLHLFLETRMIFLEFKKYSFIVENDISSTDFYRYWFVSRVIKM